MRCDFCKDREAVDHRFRVLVGFASVCESCRRYSIQAKNYQSSAGDFCCVMTSHPNQTETAATAANDGRPEGKAICLILTNPYVEHART